MDDRRTIPPSPHHHRGAPGFQCPVRVAPGFSPALSIARRLPDIDAGFGGTGTPACALHDTARSGCVTAIPARFVVLQPHARPRQVTKNQRPDTARRRRRDMAHIIGLEPVPARPHFPKKSCSGTPSTRTDALPRCPASRASREGYGRRLTPSVTDSPASLIDRFG